MSMPDRDLEAALRRELSAAVGPVEPAADALHRIRARTHKRPPQPWLLSVIMGVVTRARYWVWRGHWAWPGSLPRPSALSWPRALSRPAGKRAARGHWLRPADGNWLRPVAVLAGIAFIAAVAVSVTPLRQAIVQVGNNLTGSQQSGGTGTGGNGSNSGNGGGGPLTNGARSTTPGLNTSQSGASRGPTTTPRCQQQAGSASRIAAAVSSATRCPSPSASGATSQPVSSVATPTATSTPASGPTPTSTPTPTPTPTPTSTPTPTPTPTPTDSGTGTPTPTSSGAQTGS